MTKHWSVCLVQLSACDEAITWARTQPTKTAAWKSCKRGDWMLWLLGKLSGEPDSDARKKLVLAACACARLALKHVPKGEKRPRIAIETAERWARDEGATLVGVRAAAYAAADVAYTAYTAYAAAYTAYAAYAVAVANAAAAAAADAAAAAAADAAYTAYARTRTLAKCADIVRKHYPRPPKV